MQNFFLLLILAILSGIAKVVYDYRQAIHKNLKLIKLKLFQLNFNLALSIEFKEGLNSGNYYEEIRRNLISSINDNGLAKLIKIIDFSDIYKFNNASEAGIFRNKKNIDLIIWGHFTGDSLKSDGESISKLNLNFTYGYLDSQNGAIGALLFKDISSRLAIKNYWEIIERDSYEDVQIVSNNIFDLSIYIIALTLKIYGNITKSLKLFEQLYDSLTRKSDNFSDALVPHLLDCYYLLTEEFGVYRKKYEVGKKYCEKILKFNNKDFFALSSLAKIQYLLGEKLNAEKTIKKLSQLYPRNPITEADIAFIGILNGNYSNAFRHYENLSKYSDVNFNSQDVVEFLNDQYQIHKEPGLLYGCGIISFYFGDKTLAKRDFNRFFSKANKVKYKSMWRKAKKLIATIKT